MDICFRYHDLRGWDIDLCLTIGGKLDVLIGIRAKTYEIDIDVGTSNFPVESLFTCCN